MPSLPLTQPHASGELSLFWRKHWASSAPPARQEALEPGPGEHEGIHVARVQLRKPRADRPAHLNDAEIGASRQELRLAAD